jgi:homoserine kinase
MNNRAVWHRAEGIVEGALKRRNSNVNLSKSVEVNVPSTTANLGPGFDVFGLAHDAFVDSIKIEVVDGGSVNVDVVGVDSRTIPRDVDRNTAGIVASSLVRELPSGYGLRLRIIKRIPVGKGLGSSGASAAACVYGLNKLLGLQLSNNQMIQLAADGEVASAGSAHADNVAASVLGGFTIIQSYEPFHAIGLSPPENLRIAVAVPEVSIGDKKTAYARAMLPKLVSMEKMVRNVGHASSMIVGILTGDLDLIGRSMTDAVVEPERAKMIPGYWRVKEKALQAGAKGVAISGAGPTMIAIVDEKTAGAAQVAEAMKEGFEDEGVGCDALASKPTQGANVVKER